MSEPGASTQPTQTTDKIKKKNIAVVVAVSEYDNLQRLPGGASDAKLLGEVLHGSGRFSSIHVISGTVKSFDLKDKLATITRDNKGDVAELFVYLSGHGLSVDGAFYFLCSDYSDARHASTSLASDEVDDLARTVAPALYVKIVDACQSAVQYIKGASVADTATSAQPQPSGRIGNLYFMFSSHQHQNSYATDASFFTVAFAQAIAEHKTGSIRYRDIQAFISDAFSQKQRQRPYFVSQADNTEVFTTVTPALKSSVSRLLAELSASTGVAQLKDTGGESLVTLVKRDAENCHAQGTTLELIAGFYEAARTAALSGETAELYALESEMVDFGSEVIPAEKAVARWFSQAEDNFFVELIRRREDVEDDDSPAVRMRRTLRGAMPPISISPTDSSFEDCVALHFRPKFPNLRAWTAVLLLVPSRRNLAIITVRVEEQEKAWGVFKESATKLTAVVRPIGQFKADEAFREIFESLLSVITKAIQAEFAAKPTEEPSVPQKALAPKRK